MDAFTWLNGQLDHVEEELEETENELHAFKEKNELPRTPINDASNMLRMEMTEYTGALAKTRTQEAEISARVGELERVEIDRISSIERAPPRPFPVNRAIRVRSGVEREERARRRRQGAQPPPREGNRCPYRDDARRAARPDEEHQGRARARPRRRFDRRQLPSSRSTRARASGRSISNMKEIQYHRLDCQRDQNEKLYQFLLERLKEADLARMMRDNNIRVIDSAPEPRGAIRPVLSSNIGMGLVAGLLIGILLAWLREQLDATLKMPEDVETKLGATFLGLLPEIRDHSPHKGGSRKGKKGTAVESPELIVHKRPLSGFAEAARAVRTNLMFTNPDDPIRRILATSAAPTEGKTMVACSLAIALAQGGRGTVSWTATCGDPACIACSIGSATPGLRTCSSAKPRSRTSRNPTVVENLWSIPAGPMPPNPADALHSERFREIIRKLGEHFDRVVIDSPPLVAVTDGTILSKISRRDYFVVRAFKTSKFLCRQALRSLRDVHTHRSSVSFSMRST